jgi:hypothetical protein
MGICLVRAVSMSLRISSHIQGITQHPIKVIAPNIIRRDIKMEVTTIFHFPNHCSSQLVRGSFIPEFLASSFYKDLRPWRALVMVSSGTVLLGMNVQHSPPIKTHYPSPLFSARIMSRAIQFSHTILLVGL